MTQSGQGEEPSARPAREGIVLPSDGSEPMPPGTTGDRVTPAGGPAWGGQWGPDASAGQAPQSGDGWGAPVNATSSWSASAPDGGQGWPTADPHGAQQAQGFAQPGSGSGPLPPESAPSSAYGAQNGYAPGAHGSHAAAGYDGYGAYGSQEQHAGQGAPTPPGGEDGATQYIPYIPAAPGADEGATQFIPPVPAAPGEGATQFIPPVGPGALPPEIGAGAPQYLGQATQGGHGAGSPAPAGPDADATQYIPPVPAQPSGSFGMPAGGPEERQPPAEFDSLFRSEPEAAGATQMLPRIDGGAPQAPYGAGDSYGTGDPYGAQSAPGGRAAGRRGGPADGDGGGGARSRSRVPVIAAVGIGIIVLGVGAGALLSGGGGGDDGKDDTGKTVAATAPATQGSSSAAAADPVKAQAVELDKLLADSSNSRGSVINAVANVKACNNLGQAAGDLRDAAKQRGELVTRLSTLAVDKLPNHDQLSTSLTNAWKASAAADNHYAAWADQVGNGKKGCHKGHARTTGQTQAGDVASGTASAEKEKAARLWNSIASKYGLTQRTRTQL
ncbi:hypothetical protein ACH4S8_21595 [Streptomyces sp. NPDC021080]|uniref:hypothetical protein n=1 Tax=Streptomyces sp. NPDC021080 TaxID=3365110 RepID=UPI0037B2C5CA